MNHYEALGIAPTATHEEVRRAYARLVREHPPEKAPERFKQVRAAYEALSDPATRARHDAALKHGDEIASLLAQANAHMEAEEFKEAAPKLERVLGLSSEPVAMNLLAICLDKLVRYAESHRVWARLLAVAPDVALYHLNQGYTYYNEAADLDEDNPRRGQLLAQARHCFRDAIARDRINSSAYLMIARSYVAEDNYAEARAWCERAIKAGPGADLESLFYLCEVNLLERDQPALLRAAGRIREACAGPDQVRGAAARLGKSGLEAYKAKLFQLAALYLEAALAIDPGYEELRGFRESVAGVSDALDEWPTLKDDGSVTEAVRRLVAFYLADACGDEIEERDAALDNIIAHLAETANPVVHASVRRLRKAYPACFNLQPGVFDKIEETSRPAPSPQPPVAATPAPRPSWLPGWLAWLLPGVK